MSENLEQQVTRGLPQNPPAQTVVQSTPQEQKAKKSYPFATEVISLPSKGLVYPESNPLSSGQVTLKLMTAKEEDILTSTNLVRKGIVLDKLLESVVVDEGVNINDLVIGDKNAILISTRVFAYGPEYNITVNDPQENEPVDITVNMSNIKDKVIDYSLLNRKNEYDFTLPKCGSHIKFRLLTHGDEIAINKDVESTQKILKQANELQTRYRRIIVEVDGNRDVGYINNFVTNKLLALDSKALRKYMSDISPDIDLSFDYTSPFTGETEALKIPIGVDFFYPSE